ncbi:hypothetical protein [Hymenobacter wooponensis]|uniref:Uncharacterized protein n=1 Tax=Hymenobacter wooponensis TaxID=1525360 RepID=A0A4Z0MSP8_9BACT|nr:hypothetical protein [Hymenobacter wooponensis]TGD82843.1 hypothetical protein EU557_03420 [Hymenobacter wooponensis]
MKPVLITIAEAKRIAAAKALYNAEASYRQACLELEAARVGLVLPAKQRGTAAGEGSRSLAFARAFGEPVNMQPTA